MRIAGAFVEVQMKLDPASISKAKSTAKSVATSMDGKATIAVGVDQTKFTAGKRQVEQGASAIDKLAPDVEPSMSLGKVVAGKRQVDAAATAIDRLSPDVEASLDTSGLKAGLRDAEGSVEQSSRTMTANFARFFTAAVVVQGLRETIDAASDLEQAVGGTEAVFGDFAETVGEAAEGAANSMGLSEEAARTLTSQIGGLLKGFGFTAEEAANTSVQIAQLGADLSATFGGNPEDAVLALGSALRGEFDPLERFGVSLNQAAINTRAVELGLAASTSEVDGNARAQAALSLIMERTTDAQGQFAREADTAAGKQARLAAEFENAKAKLGGALLPIYAQAVQILTKLVGVFTSLPAPVQAGVVAMIGIAAVAGPVRDAAEAFDGLSSVIGKLGKVAPVVGALAIAVGVAFVAYQSFTAKQRELEKRTNEVGAALADVQGDVFRYALEAQGAEGAVAGLAAAQAALSQALLDSGEDGQKLEQALGVLGRQGSEAADILLDVGAHGETAMYRLAIAAGIPFDQAEELARALNETDDNAIALAYGISILGEENAGLAVAMEEVQDQAEKTDLNRVAQEGLAAAAASSEQADQLIRLAESQVGASRTSERATEVYQRYGELLGEADQVTQDAILSTGGYEGALEDVGATADNVVGKFNGLADSLAATTGPFGAADKAATDAEGKFGDFGVAAVDLGGNLNKAVKGSDDYTDSARAMRDITSDASDEFDDLSAAASRLADAIDTVIGPGDDLRETTRAVFETNEALVASLQASAEAGIDTADAFDVSSEAGRANQEQFEATRDAILAHGVAMVRNGSSAEEAAADIAYNTRQLHDQLIAAGFTEDQIADLNAEYGLTPESVDTVLALEGEAHANAVIARYNSRLGTIPADIATDIEAAIAAGDIAEAERLLNNLTTKRRVAYIGVSGPGATIAGGSSNKSAALGAYVSEDGLWNLHANEAVMPLTRPSRLREMMADERIGGPIAEAMGVGGDAAGMTTVDRGLTINGGITVGSRQDVPLITDALDEVVFLARMR